MSKSLKKYIARFKSQVLLNFYRLIDSLTNSDKAVSYRLKKNGFHNPDYNFSQDQMMFVHLPKTGGTSFSKLLLEDESGKFPHLSIHKPVSKNCSPQTHKYITVMRDPIDRVWSQYQMLLRSEKGYPYKTYADRGLKVLLDNCWAVRNMNCRYLTSELEKEPNEQTLQKAIAALESFYAVLDFEYFHDEATEFLMKHEIPFKTIPNERKASYSEPSETEREQIARYNQLDIALFQYWELNLKNRKPD